ncbi:MAG TPA: hypothetical protein VJ810_34325 [Blastocatellia bacterium]|nr:hypothetical protein [Blastocatellia bacterium]
MKKIAFSVFLLCYFAATACALDATAAAQNQTKELGSADELKDVTNMFVDTGTDMEARENIILEIRKKLREAKRELKFVLRPEDSDIHLRFGYETRTAHGGSNPGRVIDKVPVGTVVKILSKDRVRVLMSYSKERRGIGIGISLGRGKPDIEFAREFAKAYLAANSQK